MSDFYVYLHCRPNGEPFYVGKGRGTRCRVMRHRRNPHHARVVEKYGADNILVYTFPCDSESEAFKDEVNWIKQLRDEGVVLSNMTDGGEGVRGLPCSQETRMKMSAASLGRKKSPETRAKMSLAQLGNKKSLGCKMPAHVKAILIEKARGSKHMVGYKHTAESLRKMAESQTGNKHGLGRRHSDEVRARMSKARKKYWDDKKKAGSSA